MESQLPVQVLAYLECLQNVPSNGQVFRLLSKEHCHLCLLQILSTKDLLPCCLEYLINGVDVHLLFFPQDLGAVLQLSSKVLSYAVIFQFTGIELVSLPCLLRALRSFSERTATNRF